MNMSPHLDSFPRAPNPKSGKYLPSTYETTIDETMSVKLAGGVQQEAYQVPGMAYVLPFWVTGGYTNQSQPAAPDGFLVLVAPTQQDSEALNQLAGFLGYGMAGAVLLGLLLGLPLARLGLRPLERIAETADKIGEGELTKRVPLPRQVAPENVRDEVQQLGRAFNTMLDRIESAFVAQQKSEDRMRRFAADASHELRSPLTVLGGYLDVLLMGAKDDPAQQERILLAMKRENDRLSRLVVDLLLLTRLDANDPRGRALRDGVTADAPRRSKLDGSCPPGSTSPSNTGTSPSRPRRSTRTRARSATRTIATTSSRPRSGSVRTAGITSPCAPARASPLSSTRAPSTEEAADLRSEDPLEFFDLRPYTERLAEAEMTTGLGEAMVIGQAAIGGNACELAVMDFSFMGGSMGSVVGEKFSRACDSAAQRGVPLVSITASGGARMQEGILSLMQLPKTVCAVEDLHDAHQGMLSVMTHPTTAGVLASFASLGDVIVAEPGALVAFTGPRVVQQTTREKLPDDFGLAEQNLRFGHIDAIVPRPDLKPYVARFLRLFSRNGD